MAFCYIIKIYIYFDDIKIYINIICIITSNYTLYININKYVYFYFMYLYRIVALQKFTNY